MAIDVILPALGMSQDTGKIVQWLKREGEQVVKGEPLLEIETDKATVEIEAPADGILAGVSAAAGADVPVGQVIATILTPDEVAPSPAPSKEPSSSAALPPAADAMNRAPTVASPLASRIAAEHHLDLSQVKSPGRRIQKADVLAHLQSQGETVAQGRDQSRPYSTSGLVLASPKARRLAKEQGKDLATFKGSGPDGAVLAADVLAPPTSLTTPQEIAGFVPIAAQT